MPGVAAGAPLFSPCRPPSPLEPTLCSHGARGSGIARTVHVACVAFPPSPPNQPRRVLGHRADDMLLVVVMGRARREPSVWALPPRPPTLPLAHFGLPGAWLCVEGIAHGGTFPLPCRGRPLCRAQASFPRCIPVCSQPPARPITVRVGRTCTRGTLSVAVAAQASVVCSWPHDSRTRGAVWVAPSLSLFSHAGPAHCLPGDAPFVAWAPLPPQRMSSPGGVPPWLLHLLFVQLVLPMH